MTPSLIFTVFIAYTALLFLVTWITARRATNFSFYLGNKASPWYVIAYGMIGASLSGVTFMSVPGWVGTTQFSYLAVILGYVVGYAVIATVLMPLYYKLNLTTIYTYLEQRFGFWSYKTGAFFFLLSRVIGASFRMFLVVNVLQIFVFDAWHIPFAATVAIFITLIILYTFKGGIKTIIWTDTLQTTFMLAAVGISIYLISKDFQWGVRDLFSNVLSSDYSQVLVTDWHDKRHFLKQFLSGAFITIAMTGLDQEMMQKNLSCKNIHDAQKNMFTFSIVLVFVNLMFLFLGATLFLFSAKHGIELPMRSDDLFPVIAMKYLGPFAGLTFIIGLISAAYPSADGALTSLTTSFSIDFLGLNKRDDLTEKKKQKIRYSVHFSFALLLLLVIIIFRAINDQAVIDKLFTVAGYTYGPLLGLFSFGLFSKRNVKDRFVPYIAALSPVICYFLSEYSMVLFNGYKFGFELLIVNGLLTFIGLFLVSKRD
ncbi:MAG TPA: sodium:solute symporter [Bacteroidales bacterium]|nr:sodium:solute symporter [Bacteroidales bacterium]HPT01875.1 sodium:solute symporter [Bacteroidales bacterium]